MEVNIGTKVQRKTNKETFQPKVQTKKIGKSNEPPKSKIKPRIIPFPLEDMVSTQSDVIDWSSPGKPFGSQKKDKRPFVHLFISIAGALLVGTVMGFSVLTLFFSDHPNANSNTIDAHLPAPSEKTPAANKQIDQKSATIKPTSMNIPALHVSVLQAGNYQSKSSATAVAKKYRTKGFAAVMSDQAPYRIYLGVAANKKDAQKLTKRYAEKGITVYIKEQSLSGKAPEIADLIQTLKIGNQLFTQLQAISVASITNPEKAQIPANLKAKQQAFMKANQKSNAYSNEIRAAMIELARGLDQAVQGADELSKHQSTAFAWFVQEGLVRYTTGYEQLIYALSQKR
ncbi:SPOR domain-containing protein [Shimazuella alba]|uniref:SPOR domain-containing protein n=1 Tax=Shimazuella alba TaxID=2690964 RepID=A0A6I4W3H8_9BACL|nr:SPOR domain-containing protein [Shimazuella alba]MXQ55334.1 hypothetical protein [Shimazuella alba]